MARMLILASLAALVFANANGLLKPPVKPGNEGCSSAVRNCVMECLASFDTDTTSSTTTTTQPTTTTEEPTTTTEEPILAGNPGILVTDIIMNDVVFFDLVTNISTRLNLNGLDYPSDIAVDPIVGYLFISNRASNPNGYIVRTRIDGSESEVIANSSIAPQPIRIALDPNYQHVYFTDLTRSEVVTIDYGGNNEIYSVSASGQHYGLALDLAQRLVYWSAWNGGIYVAPMNTSTTTTIRENGKIGSVPGFDLDTGGDNIYYGEYAYSNRGVRTLNVDGSGEVDISDNDHWGMREVVLYGDYIFVVSATLPYIEVMPKSGGLLERLGEGDYLSDPYGMTLYVPV